MCDITNPKVGDLFRRAQFSLFPASYVEKLCHKLNLIDDEIEEAMFTLVGWDLAEIKYHHDHGDRDPIKKMLTDLRLRAFCPLVCSDPELHFQARICCPMGVIYKKFNQLCPAAGNFFAMIEVQTSVISKIADSNLNNKTQLTSIVNRRSGLLIEDGTISEDISGRVHHNQDVKKFLVHLNCFRIFSKNCVTSNVLIVDCLTQETLSERHCKVVDSFLHKIASKFTVLSVPEPNYKGLDYWRQFVDCQFQSRIFCIVGLVTPFFLKHTTSVLNSTEDSNDYSSDLESNSSSLARQRMLYVWQKIQTASHLPFYAVLLDSMLETSACQISTASFILPTKTKKLVAVMSKACNLNSEYPRCPSSI